MRTVDEILRDHDAGITAKGAESEIVLDRFSRGRHVATVRKLSRVNGLRTTCYLTLQWGIMIAALVFAGYYKHPAAYLVAALVIASRMQAIGVLLHDGVHYLLYRNRTVNDVVCDLFIAFPLGMSTTLYRKTHFRHHRFTNGEEDQDLAAQKEEGEWITWPKTRAACFWTLVRSLFGINMHKGWILYKHWSPWNNFFKPITTDFPLRSRVLYVVSMVSVYGFFVWALNTAPRTAIPLMALYVVSGITLLNLINRVRATAEHVGVAMQHELSATRTVLPSLVERLLIAPYGVNFHLEHHLFPSVPGWNLPRLHQELMKDDEFREKAHITTTYAGVIRELMTPSRDANSPAR